MAAGFSLNADKLDEFVKRINDDCRLTDEDYEEKIVIDVPMPMSYVSQELISQLSLLEPFGPGNEKPVFAQKNVELLSLKMMGAGNDMAKFSARTDDGYKAQLVLFRNAQAMLKSIDDKYGPGTSEKLKEGKAGGVLMDIIYYPSINEYQGRKTLQFIIGDYK